MDRARGWQREREEKRGGWERREEREEREEREGRERRERERERREQREREREERECLKWNLENEQFMSTTLECCIKL